MKKILSLITFGTIIAFSLCQHFLCNNTLTKGVCSRKSLGSDGQAYFQINPCDKGLVCDFHFGSEDDLCISNKTLPTKYPGEICNDSYECISGICKVQSGIKICQAPLQKGDLCGDNSQCPVGTSCAIDPENTDYTRCFDLLGVNESQKTCDFTPGGFKCQTNLVCNNGKCIKPGSLKEGNKTFIPFACNTFYMFKEDNENDFKCAKGPFLTNSSGAAIITNSPVRCKENDPCYYSINYNKKNISLPTKTCPVSMNNFSSGGYCHPGIKNLQKEIDSLFNYLKNYNGSCHISKGMFCNFYNQTDSSFFLAYSAYLKLTQYSQVYNNSECIQKLLTSDYQFASHFSSHIHSLLSNVQYIFLLLALCVLIL